MVRAKVEAARVSPETVGVRRQKQRGSGKKLTATVSADKIWECIVFGG